MTAAWKYGDQNQLGHGDTICIYIDGVLFAEDEPKSALPRHAKLDSHTQLANKLYLMKQIVDKRPVFGGFKDVQPSLVAQFTFDVDLEYIVQERWFVATRASVNNWLSSTSPSTSAWKRARVDATADVSRGTAKALRSVHRDWTANTPIAVKMFRTVP